MYICDVHKSSLRFHCSRDSVTIPIAEFTDEKLYHLSVTAVSQEMLQHQGDTYLR